MALYVYREADGELVSWCHDDDDQVASDEDLKSGGLIVQRSLPLLDDTHKWDAAKRTIVEVAAPILPRPLATGRWVMRFTPEEFDAISTSTDKIVKHFMYALNRTVEIDLNDPVLAQGIGYLAFVGLIKPARVAEIMV